MNWQRRGTNHDGFEMGSVAYAGVGSHFPSLMWAIWVFVSCPMESREDMIAVLALISVPCALWYALLFAIGRRLDKDQLSLD